MEFILGQVPYELVTSHTVFRMQWMGAIAAKAGFAELLLGPPPTDEAAADKLLREIVTKAFAARVTVDLLAGGLTRTGEKWSEAQAEANRSILGEVEEAEAMDAVALVLWDFVKSEPAMLRSMLLCSLPPGMGTEASPLNPNPVRSSPINTASGTPSPGPLPATTLIASPPSASGS